MAHILIIDDDQLVVATAKDLLEGAGHTVAANNMPLGVTGFADVKRPELTLLGVDAPPVGISSSDCSKLVTALRECGRGASAPVMLYSMSGEPALADLVKSSGADGYIHKTTRGESLVKAVASRLGTVAPAVTPTVAPAATLMETAILSPVATRWTESAVLLLVEDDDLLQRLSEIFCFIQLPVDIASDPDEAKSMVSRNNYDVLICESQFSDGVKGVDVYSELLAASPRLKGRAIFLITTSTSETIFAAKTLGCRYLSKPVEAKHLMDKVDEIRKERGDADRRADVRYSWTGGCRISAVADFDALVQDLSLGGLKVRHTGDPLSSGSTVKVRIKELSIVREALVKWSRPQGDSFEAGLSFDRAIPSTYINFIVPS